LRVTRGEVCDKSVTARSAFIILTVLFLSACDQAGTTTALPVPTTAPVHLQPFNGTLQPQTTNVHAFSVSQEGYVEVTLVGLSAPAGTKVSLGVGIPSVTGTCATTYTVTTTAGPSAQIVGTGLIGTHCVMISDVGNLTEAALYTITVASS